MGMQKPETIRRRAAVLRDLERSGISMAEYCRRRGLVYATVAAWRSMARRKAARFIELEAVPECTAPDSPVPVPTAYTVGMRPVLCAELALPGGMLLRIYQQPGEGGAA